MSLNGISLTLITVAAYIIRTELRHRINVNQEFQNEYDFIVVGSGSSGAIFAYRLAECGNTVLLLEAGGPNGIPNDIPSENINLPNSKYNWNYTMIPLFVGKDFRNGRIRIYSGKVLGGSSSFNGMIFNRGNRRDFDRWQTEFGADGWSYENVLKIFMRYENNTDPNITANGLHGTDCQIEVTSWPQPDIIIQKCKKALNQMGFPNTDVNGPVQYGTVLAQAMIDTRGVRSSTVNAYLDPNPFFENLHIIVRAFVTKILFNKNIAKGVQFVRHRETYKVMARKEIIVPVKLISIKLFKYAQLVFH